ncbi:hypothetical protein E4T47_06465 [Aureobasidium subglaciale]|nr:hypothetical protein E4T47_06465 [Aureobasidium subglaciale]
MRFVEAQLFSSFGRIADMKMCHHNGKDDNATKISADERTECQRETAHHADTSHKRLRAGYKDNNTAQQTTTDNIADAVSWRGPKIPSCPLKHNDNAMFMALKEMKMLGTTGRRMISEMRLQRVAIMLKMRSD